MLLTTPWSLSNKEATALVYSLLDTMRNDRAVELHIENNVSFIWSDLNLQAAQKQYRIGLPAGNDRVTSWEGKSGKRVKPII